MQQTINFKSTRKTYKYSLPVLLRSKHLPIKVCQATNNLTALCLFVSRPLFSPRIQDVLPANVTQQLFVGHWASTFSEHFFCRADGRVLNLFTSRNFQFLRGASQCLPRNCSLNPNLRDFISKHSTMLDI